MLHTIGEALSPFSKVPLAELVLSESTDLFTDMHAVDTTPFSHSLALECASDPVSAW